MSFIKLSSKEYPVGEWMGGNTIEIVKFPIHATFKKQDFDFRLSKAQLYKEQSTFTYLPNYHRQLVNLTGGVRLDHEEQTGTRSMQMQVYDIDCFPGDIVTNSYGSGSDFNLIYKNHLQPTLKTFDSAERCKVSLKAGEILVVYSNLPLSDIEIIPENDYLQETVSLTKDDTLLFWNETNLELIFHRASLEDSKQKVAIVCQIDLSYAGEQFDIFLEHYKKLDTYDQ